VTEPHPGEVLRAEVNRTKCCGYGICAELCPSVFKLDDAGFSYVAGPVAPEDEAAAREAEDQCPEEAIRLLQGESGDAVG
jgi:ferredoxin